MLHVRVEHWNGLARLRLAGEVDVSSEMLFQRALEVARERARKGIIVDLSGLRFMDSTGIAALLDARKRADEGGLAFEVRGARQQVHRVFVVSGLHWLFEDPGHPVIEEAEGAPPEAWEPVLLPED